MVPVNGEIEFFASDFIHALFTAGRAPGDRLSHGEVSVWEFLHRYSLIRAYLRQDNSQHVVLSRLARELDRSEKTAISYAIGQAMTCIFAQSVLSIRYLMHIDRYSSRWGVGFAGRKRPDMFGLGPLGWIVAEAKGRTGAPDLHLRERMTAQKASVISVQGAPPAIALGCVSYFNSGSPWLRMDVFDPPPDELTPFSIEVDIDRFIIAYYEPFIAAIEIGDDGADYSNRVSETASADIIATGFEFWNLSVGLLRSIFTAVQEAKSSGNIVGLNRTILRSLHDTQTESLFPDGTFIDAHWRDTISINDWMF